MKKSTTLLCGFVPVLISVLWLTPVHAKPAQIDPIAEENITAHTATLRYKNIAAVKKFKFELWDKRVGRTVYRKIDVFFKKRTSKQSKYFSLTLTNLKPDRDYQIRYRPVYLGDRLGLWSEYAQFHTKKQAVYFTINFGVPIADSDFPYLIVDDSSTTSAALGSYLMNAVDEDTYEVIVEDVDIGDELKFVAARNTTLPRTFEQFDPDNPTHLRSFTVETLPDEHEFTVDGWRWYNPSLSIGDISIEDWPITTRERLSLSVGLEPIYDESFTALTTSTMQAMAESGLRFVTIHIAPRMIINGDPVETTNQKIPNYPNDEELAALFVAAKTAGLTIIMAIDFPIDPENEDAIEEQMQKTHGNSYFSTYLTRWREAMNDGIDVANDNDIAIIVFDTDFLELTYQNNEQQAYVSHILKNDLLPAIGSGFDGIITTEELSSDADFDWYESEAIDWLGDTWYPDLTNSTAPTVAEMYTEAKNQLAATYATANATYGKPVFFHQLGVMSWRGAVARGEDFNPENSAIDPDKENTSEYVRDYQEQADAYEALFRAIAEVNYVYGAGSIGYTYYIQHDKLENIRNKPAENVWSRWEELFSAAL